MAIPIINVSILNGSNGFRLDGAGSTYFYAVDIPVSSAGDINGDGFDDVMVGAFSLFYHVFVFRWRQLQLRGVWAGFRFCC